VSDHAWQLVTLAAPEIWRRLAAELAAAAASARHPLHLLTVATINSDGFPAARTVVLREFDPERREVRFHTDRRSPKATQLARDGRVALHWYDPRARLQIRIVAQATLHHLDETARAAWLASQPMSRACYHSAASPGTPLPEFPASPQPPAPDDDAALANFAVVRCRFTAVELLALHASGHERIRLEPGGPIVTGTILAP
jgi:pyridoxamine 5'-phosphate oxidase